MKNWSSMLTENTSDNNYTSEKIWKEFVNPFDELRVKIIFCTLYSIIFACCFFGNLLVLYIITTNARLRTRTNFFLANLAVADFCVGIFCVFPNLSLYISPMWHFGRAMCKIYYFTHYMSLTVPVLLLTVISIERYVAILHPLKAKKLFTFKRFRIVQVLIWLLMVAYNSPQLIDYDTFTIGNNTYCYMKSENIQTNIYILANMIIWYVIPLMILTFVYIRIATTLWRSSVDSNLIESCHSSYSVKCETNVSVVAEKKSLTHYFTKTKLTIRNNIHSEQIKGESIQLQNRNDSLKHPSFCHGISPILESQTEQESVSDCDSQAENERIVMNYSKSHQSSSDSKQRSSQNTRESMTSPSTSMHSSKSGSRYSEAGSSIGHPRIRTHKVIEARKKVIILLIMIICSFAILALPYYIRNCLYVWIDTTSLGSLLSPICYLLYYANSGLNPLLYALLSKNFRRSFRDSFICRKR